MKIAKEINFKKLWWERHPHTLLLAVEIGRAFLKNNMLMWHKALKYSYHLHQDFHKQEPILRQLSEMQLKTWITMFIVILIIVKQQKVTNTLH